MLRRSSYSGLNGFRPNLAMRFAIAGSLVLVVCAVVAGTWMGREIERNVVENTARATGVFLDGVVGPLVRSMAETDTLSPDAVAAMSAFFTRNEFGAQIVSYKIWTPSGLVVYASDPDLIGRTFEPDDAIRQAVSGEVAAQLEDVSPEDGAEAATLGVSLLEVYSPVRDMWSGDVIAVAEVYLIADRLRADIDAAWQKTWAVVAGMMLVTGGLLFAIVRGGSRVIEDQQVTLEQRVEELDSLNRQNIGLQRRITAATRRTAEHMERYLRRTGAELHDGPAQSLSYIALRLDALRAAPDDAHREQILSDIETTLNASLDEIRGISRGLVLPAIEALPLSEAIGNAVAAHRNRTGSETACDIFLPTDLVVPGSVKICAYRFVQEGLWNAWRHAGGLGHSVRAAVQRNILVLEVRDAGPGIAGNADDKDVGGLGLAGLRNRVESLGGEFRVFRPHGGGTCLRMSLWLEGDGIDV